YKRNQFLALMKRFYLCSFEVSKNLKQHYNINDPFTLIFLVLEYVSKYKKFSDAEIKIINERLKKSINAAMVQEGGCSNTAIENFITEKIMQVDLLLKSNPLKEKFEIPIE